MPRVFNISDTIDPKPAGENDPLEPLAADANLNGISDGAEKYPSYLNGVFENQQPRARFFGATTTKRRANTPLDLRRVRFDPVRGRHLAINRADRRMGAEQRPSDVKKNGVIRVT